MERLRLWTQTLALAGLAIAALGAVYGPLLRDARAAAPPTCELVDSGKLMWDKAGDDIRAQAEALIALRGDREHVSVIPFGRMASGGGGIYSVVCVW